MKKTLLIACILGFIGSSQKSVAAISQTECDWSWVKLNPNGTTTVGNSTINWAQTEGASEAVITGLNTDLFKFTLNLGWNNGNQLENIAYVSGVYNKNGVINESLTKQWGFYATGDGVIVGNNNGEKYTAGPTTLKNTLTSLDTNSDQKVDLLARFNKDKDGSILWSENKSSTLYNGEGLRYGDYPILTLTVNTNLVASVFAKEAVEKYKYANAAGTWAKICSVDNVLYKSSGEAKYTHNTQAEAGTKDIIISGSGLFYVSSYENANNKGDVTLGNNIYLGASTNNYGSAHFNNNDGVTTLNGSIYIVEDAVISARGTQDVIVNGTVTDKNVDGSADLGTKLTLKGQGYIFNNVVNVTSIEFADNTQGTTRSAGATFKQGFIAEKVIMNGGSVISSDVELALTDIQVNNNATLSADLTLDGGLLNMAGSLKLGNHSLTLGIMELSGSKLDALIAAGDGFVTLFENVSSVSLIGDSSRSIYDFSQGVEAEKVFTNLEAGKYTLVHTDGNVRLAVIPEPTTATLSLLALVGLAARRRRR